ncbi:HAD-IA family hydrolase [Flavobacteriaceae bacterium]|nr:HAD-IA family hydrolase [Flavobacteriaceae bacterium]
MIKAILFDLDGVLIEAKNIHFEALNNALPDNYKISWKEHLSIYDGLKTNQKLELLTKKKGLPPNKYSEIWKSKQENTLSKLEKLKKQSRLIILFNLLKKDGYKIAVCSNSIKKTIITVLTKFEIIEFVEFIISNEDVANAKPHPEMYWSAMSKFNVFPYETLIIEDSPHGLMAASATGAKVLRVKNSKEVTKENIYNMINNSSQIPIPAWKDNKMNIVIPMAGAGSRFAKAGFTFPKPLIEVNGKPMIQVVLENLNIDANYIFIVQNTHRKKYNLDAMLKILSPNCKIIETDGLTEGAACTALLAKKFINNDNPLFFANSDQFVEWNSNEFFYKMNENDVDGGIVTFESTHPKWSYAKINEDGNVTEVQEKKPISKNATVGFYYFKKGRDFIKNAEEMILNNDRVNNEFYLCPVYNYLIKKGGTIKISTAEKMWGLGTPEDLDTFLKSKNN